MHHLTPKAEQPKKEAATTPGIPAERKVWVTPDIELISVSGGSLRYQPESQTAPPFHEHGILS